MAYYGNLALRPERVEEQKVQPPIRNNNMGKNKVPSRRPIPLGEKLIYLVTIAVVVMVAGFIIYRYAQIYQINGQIQTKNKTYEQATVQTKELQREVEKLSDLDTIKKKATALGYVPVSEKIVVSKDDPNEVAIKP
ncbi:cell division protein FtsL [Cohnella abietis]|uniref:Cell division protein FtsL n=1 Tax=Cohnella abietis TaxID=2507935 RepID=A0A3T1D998_9BACL|nr:septum formation initiator family protein [Cohnella abietis]BBI34681.1 hypothetical protein KCTCHS21_40800 [Cohnella abietis]